MPGNCNAWQFQSGATIRIDVAEFARTVGSGRVFLDSCEFSYTPNSEPPLAEAETPGRGQAPLSGPQPLRAPAARLHWRKRSTDFLTFSTPATSSVVGPSKPISCSSATIC